MSRIRASATAVIEAPAATVYDIIADYREMHPAILPKEHFQDLRVEQGGRGAGTIISFTSIANGQKRPLRMAISEPEPGRRLVEKDTASSMTTTFTVTSLGEGRSNVEIATELDPSPGLMGFIERLVVPGTLRRIYVKELAQLAQVAGKVSRRA
jgi:hypothetical protein